ncbi:MAG: serine hydrolase domain-containing protein [Pseudomonadota bacterium]|nr:serine hydrolase domain-containing protein [Pseudomonadota bacterium]
MKTFLIAACAAALLIAPCTAAQTAGPAADSGGAPTATDALDALLDALDFSGTLLVARGGEVVRREAVNPASLDAASAVTPQSRFPIASMTKSFTAALVLGLVDEGQLDLDQTLADLLPDFDVSYSGEVTLRHLLQNRSGIPHYIEIPGWFDTEVKQAFTEETFLEALEALEPKFPPGSDYLYSNVNYYLLARIVDRHCGMTYEACLRSRILDPLGLSETGQIYADPGALATNYLRDEDGAYEIIPVTNPALFRGTASLYATIDDLGAWGQAVLDGAVYSDAAEAEAFNADTPMAWDIGRLPLGENETVEVVYYNGRLIGYLSLILLLPEQDGVIVVLNNNTVGYSNMLGIAGALAAAYFGEPG